MARYLYTSEEGGYWKMKITDVTTSFLKEYIQRIPDSAIENGLVIKERIPDRIRILPTFHSILLPDGNRWDAISRKFEQQGVEHYWRMRAIYAGKQVLQQ